MDRRQIAIHDAAFTVIGRALDVAIRPPAERRGLRLFEGNIFLGWKDRNSAEIFERMAVIVLAGHAALTRCQEGAHGTRDELLGQDLVFAGLLTRYGPALMPSFVRSYVRNRMTELTAEAARLVTQHWPEIEAETAGLLAGPHRQPV